MVGRVVLRVRRDCHGRVVELGGRGRSGVGSHFDDVGKLNERRIVCVEAWGAIDPSYRIKTGRGFTDDWLNRCDPMNGGGLWITSADLVAGSRSWHAFCVAADNSGASSASKRVLLITFTDEIDQNLGS